jgi:hypothetical protein
MVTPITDVADLRRHLQWAIEVEHATIPPYEYAMWSVVDPDSAAATSIKYVAREEMLHAALAANLLTAVGGSPRFTAGSVPRYPGPMPHHSPAEPLILHLAPASLELVRDVFLRIEQPEAPGSQPEADRYETLAQFYEAIADAMALLGDEVFSGDPHRQVTRLRGPRRGRAVRRHGPGHRPARDRGDRRTGRRDTHVGRFSRGVRSRSVGPSRDRTVRLRGGTRARALLAVPRHRRGQDAHRRASDARRPLLG